MEIIKEKSRHRKASRFTDLGNKAVLYGAFISFLCWLTQDVWAVVWTQEVPASILVPVVIIRYNLAITRPVVMRISPCWQNGAPGAWPHRSVHAVVPSWLTDEKLSDHTRPAMRCSDSHKRKWAKSRIYPHRTIIYVMCGLSSRSFAVFSFCFPKTELLPPLTVHPKYRPRPRVSA